jgi:hypothetical protein
MINRLVFFYRLAHYRERPLPRIGLGTRAALPGWMIRLVAAAAAVACVGLPGGQTILPGGLVAAVAGLTGVWMLRWPGYAAALTAISTGGLSLLGLPGTPLSPLAPVVAATGYVAWRLALVAALVPWRGRAAVRAVVGWRDLAILGLTALVGTAAWLPGTTWWYPLLGVAGLAVLVAVIGGRTR